MKATLLFPFTLIYYVINIIWEIYWRLKRQVRVSARVVSIGNLAVGGSGKTSLVALLARKLLNDGKKVAVVARGYGRPIKEPISICGPDNINWRKAGDEPAMLAKMIPGLHIYIDSSKTEAARRAAADGFEYIIIDDGFQHRRLYRDIDIVCIDSRKPFGNGLLLPSGILREPPGALKRADIIVAFGDTPLKPGSFYGKPLFRASKKTSSITAKSGTTASLAAKKIVAFCGLGNPESFENSLNEAGCDITDFIEFRDHHIYNKSDIENIVRKIEISGAEGTVTTLKDFVKIEDLWPSEVPLYRLDITIELDNGAEFYKLI